MTRHRIEWFESMDGQIFTDEMECYKHEMNVLYRKSGVVFYIGDQKIDEIETNEDKTYNEMTDIFIDRSKEEENKIFCEFIRYNAGWCYVDDALEGTGSHYRFSESPFDPIQEVAE